MANITNKVHICNLAMDYIGGQTVSNITEPITKEEELCQRWYDVSRRKLLREHSWNFAQKYIILSKADNTPVFTYTHAFNLPADFIRLLSVGDQSIQRYTDYEIHGNQIFCDCLSTTDETLKITYIANVENVSLFDAEFCDLLALTLAIKLAYTLNRKSTQIQLLYKLYAEQWNSATAIDGQECPPKVISISAIKRTRKYGL